MLDVNSAVSFNAKAQSRRDAKSKAVIGTTESGKPERGKSPGPPAAQEISAFHFGSLRLCFFALIRVQAANGESKNLTEANGANGEGILLKMHNWGLSLRVANP